MAIRKLGLDTLKTKLINAKDTEFINFVLESYEHKEEVTDNANVKRNIENLMLLEKNELEYVKIRLESLVEYHDPVKMDAIVLPATSILVTVLGTGFFLNQNMIGGSTSSMIGSAICVLLFWGFVVLSFIMGVMRPGKKKHGKIVFFSKIIDLCIEEKEKRESKKKQAEQEKESFYNLICLNFEKQVKPQKMKETKRIRRKRYGKR
ncbi:hypothetical protein AB1I80_10790 [Bacillus paranthracis]|uniref:hypothetical protein n=1 Tax=Bacillus paranthracis TaxID=2026186 RepID=UPI00355681A6